jgi:hypothetical protein
MSDLFLPGLFLGLSIGLLGTVVTKFESNQQISPEEYSYYDDSCLKAASTTKVLSIDTDDAVLKCHNGATFEFDRWNYYEKEIKE